MKHILFILILMVIPMIIADNYTIEQSMTALTAGDLSDNYSGRFSGAIHQPLSKSDTGSIKGMIGILYDNSINPTKISLTESSRCGSQVCFDMTISTNESSTPKIYYWTANSNTTDYEKSYDKAELPAINLLSGTSQTINRCLYFNGTDNYIRARTDYDIYSNLAIVTINKNFTCNPVNLPTGGGGTAGYNLYANNQNNCGLSLYSQPMSIMNREIRYVVLDSNMKNAESKVEQSIFLKSNGDYIKSKLPLLFTTNIGIEAKTGQCQTVMKIPVDIKSVIFTYIFIFLFIGTFIYLIARQKRK